MSHHNIIGSERSGPHFVIRRFKAAPARRTFLDVVLSAIGGLVVLIALFAFLTKVMS